jgi:hypothetical protein
MAEIKTKETIIEPLDFIDAIEEETRRNDALIICEIMTQITGHTPKMWGPTIIGFDKYDYKYESGHGGTMCKIGFSPRKAAHTLYLALSDMEKNPLLMDLGKHKIGKGCLYVKKLKDIDLTILRKLIANSYSAMCEKYD